VLLKAGITLKDALDLQEQSVKKKGVKEQLHQIASRIISGQSLSEAITTLKAFTNYEYHSLRIGEETGTLETVTEQLGAFYARKNEQRRTLVSALTYPFIILITAFLVVFFMLNYVVPMFQDIFEQQNVELPKITKVIISCSEFLKANGLFLFGILLLLIFGFYAFKNQLWFKKWKDTLVSKLPFIGRFTKTVYLSQFTQAVALLTSAKVPIVNGIQLVREMINFYPLQQALTEVETEILKGNSLSESLKTHAFFDEKMVAMVKVAEETNQNEFIFERLNTQYNTQVNQQSKLLSTVMEPFIILIVGVLVGVILIAMYLPMFRLSSVIG
jgi:type IV pilus assembly protein PilC